MKSQKVYENPKSFMKSQKVLWKAKKFALVLRFVAISQFDPPPLIYPFPPHHIWLVGMFLPKLSQHAVVIMAFDSEESHLCDRKCAKLSQTGIRICEKWKWQDPPPSFIKNTNMNINEFEKNSQNKFQWVLRNVWTYGTMWLILWKVLWLQFRNLNDHLWSLSPPHIWQRGMISTMIGQIHLKITFL